jgi:hypothetical protein
MIKSICYLLDTFYKWFFVDRFKPRLILRKGFWILIGQGIKAHFGKPTVVIVDNNAYSVGLVSPDKELRSNSWSVRYVGRVVGKVVLFYERT